MINFRQKEFGKTKEVIKFIKKFPTVPLSAATLGISSANLAVNTRRHKEAGEYQKEQLKAMGGLTDALTGVDKTLRKSEISGKKDAGKDKRKKLFSINSRIIIKKKNINKYDKV